MNNRDNNNRINNRKNNKTFNKNHSLIKRNEFETDLSYKSRQIFIMTAINGNNKKITDELIQLSNIFVNVTILGCSYPQSILKKVFNIANKINKKIYSIKNI